MVHNHQYLMRHRLYTRLLVLARVYTRAIRARLRSRQTQIMGGGTKRGSSSPCASSSALKVTSVRSTPVLPALGAGPPSLGRFLDTPQVAPVTA